MPERRPVLLTVSGRIPDTLDQDVAEGRRPRADYRVLAEILDADIVDVDRALGETGLVGRLLHRIGGAGLLLGWSAFRRRRSYEVVLTDGEQVGIPMALLTRVFGKRGCAHVMIVHVLSASKKQRVMRAGKLAREIDRYVTYCSAQSAFIHGALRVPANRIVQSTFMVDTAFFDRSRFEVRPSRTICSAGLERRDYRTLLAAVDGLDVSVVIAAASPWSKQPDSSAGESLPSNVTVRRLDLFELRKLYAESAFVVMPLADVDFQAGITTILEAMSMGLAVVCTRTMGQVDTIINGATGLYVPPGDVIALRAAIEMLLREPIEAARLGTNAREWVVANADVEVYARSLGTIVTGVGGLRVGLS